ncbi:MAG: hypothetical protein M3O89_10335 [Actinomycetota bacterium]|nr:hypothetical protein [Actinomycetota bacterium]
MSTDPGWRSNAAGMHRRFSSLRREAEAQRRLAAAQRQQALDMRAAAGRIWRRADERADWRRR